MRESGEQRILARCKKFNQGLKRLWFGGIHESRMIGPYFFSQPSVTGSNYKRMLRYYVLSKVQELLGSPIFQEDGAPTHHSISVRQYFDLKLLRSKTIFPFFYPFLFSYFLFFRFLFTSLLFSLS